MVALFLTGAVTAQGIPGIDPLPRANAEERKPPASSEQKPGESAPSTQTNQPAADSGKPGEEKAAENQPGQLQSPVIRNLRAEKVPDDPYSVRLTWEVDPANDTAIYVGRYVRPTTSRELVLEAENISTPPLGPKETTYLDRNIPDGAYYYVVVTVYEMSARDRLRLQANGNHTVDPMIIYRAAPGPQPQPGGQGQDTPQNQESPYEVRGLTAVNAQNSVKLNWGPPDARDVTYNIYRSVEPMANENALKVAQRLAQAPASRLYYEDLEPLAGRVAYYGVTVTDNRTGREYLTLTLNRSYVQNIFQPTRITEDRGRQLPQALTAFLENRNTIKLLWVDPEAPLSGLRVYRSPRPIANAQSLERAELLGEVRKGVNEYRDANLAAGVYYYALIPRDPSLAEVRTFAEGRTFTGIAMRINVPAGEEKKPEEKKPEEKPAQENADERARTRLNNLRQTPGADFVQLEWDVLRAELSRDYRVAVYRAATPLRNFEDLRARGELLTELPRGVHTYVDGGLRPGRYYYALALTADGRSDPNMSVGRNFLADPAVVTGPQKPAVDNGERPGPGEDRVRPDASEGALDEIPGGPSMVALNRILAATYFRSDYGEAVRRLAPYVMSQRVPAQVRAKAMLYTGMAYYQMRQYRRAMEFFLHETVRREYPERARFWYNRSLERSR